MRIKGSQTGFSRYRTHRIPPLWRDLRQRHENECTIHHPRMRHFQIGGPQYEISESEQVDVDNPRAVPLTPTSALTILDSLGSPVEFINWKHRATCNDEIQKIGLIQDPDRFSTINIGDLFDLHNLTQLIHR